MRPNPSTHFKACLSLSHSNTSFQLCLLLCFILRLLMSDWGIFVTYSIIWTSMKDSDPEHNASPNNDLPSKERVWVWIILCTSAHIIFSWPFPFDILNLSPKLRIHTNTPHTYKTLIDDPFPDLWGSLPFPKESRIAKLASAQLPKEKPKKSAPLKLSALH